MADKLPVWAAWLFTTPWWVPGLLALALTAWMMWITRPTARVLDGPTGAVPQSPGVDLLEAQARLTHTKRAWPLRVLDPFRHNQHPPAATKH